MVASGTDPGLAGVIQRMIGGVGTPPIAAVDLEEVRGGRD
jgi:hypothetical protein